MAALAHQVCSLAVIAGGAWQHRQSVRGHFGGLALPMDLIKRITIEIQHQQWLTGGLNMAVDTSVAGPGSDVLDRVINEGGYSFRQALVVVICMLVNMVDGFDVAAMAYAAPSVRESWGLGADQLGIVFSLTLAGMMIGGMFLAPISDSIGRRRTVIVSVLVIGISMIATAFVTTLTALIVLRVICGLGIGAMLASLAAIGSEYSPQRYRSMAVTLVTVGYPLGVAVGGSVAAPLIPQYGWESIFLAAGFTNLVLVVLAYFFMPESLHFLARNNKDGKALEKVNKALKVINKPALDALPEMHTPRPESTQQKSGTGFFGPVAKILTPEYRRNTLMIWVTFFFGFVSIYFILSFIPIVMEDAGYTRQQGIAALTWLNYAGFAGVLIFSWFSTRFPLSNVLGGFLGLGGLSMVAVVLLPHNYPLVFFFMILIGLSGMAGFTALYSMPAKVYSTERRATGIGWAVGLGRSGAVVGPYLAGLAVAGGVAMGMNFLLFGIPMLVAALLVYSMRVH